MFTSTKAIECRGTEREREKKREKNLTFSMFFRKKRNYFIANVRPLTRKKLPIGTKDSGQRKNFLLIFQ